MGGKKSGKSSYFSSFQQELQERTHLHGAFACWWSLRCVCGLEKEDGKDMMMFRKMPLTFSQSSFFLFLLTSPHPLLTFMSGTRSTEL